MKATLGSVFAFRGVNFGAEGEFSAADLPKGAAPAALEFDHFPSRLHAFVWRNWQLVPAERMARVVGSNANELIEIGHAMGLAGPPQITAQQQRRSRITVIRANWHLLPYSQLLTLLGMTAQQLDFMLREDDFLFVKLGNLKPQCAPLQMEERSDAIRKAEGAVKRIIDAEFPEGIGVPTEPLFTFVKDLSSAHGNRKAIPSKVSPRYCYSYFALYGDPLLEPDLDPYPDGYLARLAEAGVDGVWLQGVLKNLAPYPYAPKESEGYQERLKNLRSLVARLKKHGMRLFLYLNEPRSLPLKLFGSRPELKGVIEGNYAALCTSIPEVREYLTGAIERICRAAPNLGGFFTITGSENLSNCWSHGKGADCPQCSKRTPAEVISELHAAFYEGISRAGTKTELIAWDWGWADDWTPGIVERLPKEVALMSVSEWSTPIRRGGVSTAVGEYSISVIGPGPRATKHWALARQRGLKTLAKIQAGNTWELSAVPYIQAIANVAEHAGRLRNSGVNGLMLGWTLGGYPSPNLEVVSEIFQDNCAPEEAMLRVAERRFGKAAAPAVTTAWREFSAAFSEFPYHGAVVYSAPMQLGASNLLWKTATGYHATMVGFCYDDLTAWRGPYPEEAFIGQFEKVGNGWAAAREKLSAAILQAASPGDRDQQKNLASELRVAEAAEIHFKSVANQARFVFERRKLEEQKEHTTSHGILEKVVRNELDLAKRMHALQSRDSRFGFEATNQYYYVPNDLAEKILNCHRLLDR